MPESATGHWKRSRTENFSQSPGGNKSRATHAESWGTIRQAFARWRRSLFTNVEKASDTCTSTSAGTNLNRDILDELTERLGNSHDSARAMASCLQTRDVTRNTDQSMIEAAKYMLHKLLGEASDDLECVTPLSRKSLHVETTRNQHRCSRFETPSEKPCSRSETLVEKSCSRFETTNEQSVWQTPTDGMPMLVPIPSSPPDRTGIWPVKLEPVSKTQPSRESGIGCRRRFSQAAPLYELGEWKYEFKMPSLIDYDKTEFALRRSGAEGKTQHLQMHIGPGSDGSSADKLSLDLKFNSWDTAIIFQPEWRSMSKTVFTQYDPFESWYTEHSDVWLDDVRTFYHRPMRCVIVVHPYPLAQEDTALLTESTFLSCAKICITDSRLSPDLHMDKRVTLHKKQKNDISNSTSFITETHQVMWSLLTNTILHGRIIMYMVTPALKEV